MKLLRRRRIQGQNAVDFIANEWMAVVPVHVVAVIEDQVRIEETHEAVEVAGSAACS